MQFYIIFFKLLNISWEISLQLFLTSTPFVFTASVKQFVFGDIKIWSILHKCIPLLIKSYCINYGYIYCAQSLIRVWPFVTPWTVPTRLLCPWGPPGKNTRVGCHFLFQGIFLTQGLNLCLLHWQADSLPLSCLGSPLDLFNSRLLPKRKLYITSFSSLKISTLKQLLKNLA